MSSNICPECNQNSYKLIQEAQLNANYNWELIEWISYDRFKDEWDIENQQWKRWGEGEVALKKFDNFVNFNDVLNEDFHPGNILLSNFNDLMMISDFGLSKLIRANPNNLKKKNIFGVLPYIAPEVLNKGEYTKAADVHSFGIIAYEIITGFPPYPDYTCSQN
ncbi:hypothetical protein Glove_271g93 [Diversispora epigaea]|uniref:Protein kinase domain-containing protein n=1 Tax=Diversispora epigaea TaxID=1348612 RepID=A0A397IAL8_9GLOM|nr:hypothetical protein Glove_271g93 [Diversispora epigaea]